MPISVIMSAQAKTLAVQTTRTLERSSSQPARPLIATVPNAKVETTRPNVALSRSKSRLIGSIANEMTTRSR